MQALATHCPADTLASLLARSGLNVGRSDASKRVTLYEIARLYKLAVPATADEMMGLWSRPVRPRALQHLVTIMREASSQTSALYRFSTFWNLILDDYQLELSSAPDSTQLTLVPASSAQQPQRFGHMLILKLAHGLLSWLGGAEAAVKSVQFAFSRPDFASDYSVIFPCPVSFSATRTAITFDGKRFSRPIARSAADASAFVERAPLDWLFTGSRTHTNSLRVRASLYQATWQTCQLQDVAETLKMTPRTLSRRLQAEGTSFQEIKDALRRDIAIRALQQSDDSIDAIAFNTGFSDASNFHRAFRKWTKRTPKSYRKNNDVLGADPEMEMHD